MAVETKLFGTVVYRVPSCDLDRLALLSHLMGAAWISAGQEVKPNAKELCGHRAGLHFIPLLTEFLMHSPDFQDLSSDPLPGKGIEVIKIL